MPQFIYGTALSLCIEEVISNANEYLFLISPYIKLHDRIKDELKKKKSNDKLKIIVMFGKNEEDRRKSLSLEDLNFLKDFPNIQICYEKNLHAKFYASESCSLITSMNLHQFSQNTNVEVGVQMFPKSLVASLANTIKPTSDCDEESINYFKTVVENSEKLFVKIPEYEPGLFKKKYVKSILQVDQLEKFFNQPTSDYRSIRPNSFNQYANSAVTALKDTDSFKPGYCIRTGVKIQFNPGRPLCTEAFKTWSKYNDITFHEVYCHFSGEPSLGQTSLGKPILTKNLSRAKKFM